MRGNEIAIETIRTLKSRYFRFIDEKNWNSMRGIFCENAVFDIRDAFTVNGDAQGTPWEKGDSRIIMGAEAIVDLLRDFLKMRSSVHHGHGHEIDVLSTTEARGVIAMEDIVLEEDGQTVLIHGWGHYHERYRVERGEWRILHSRLTRLHLTGTLSDKG